MKNFKFGFFGALTIAGAMFFTGCTDVCKDVVCNSGECVEGDCVCDAGYEGVACDAAFNAKFVGTYNLTETCDSTPPTAYPVTVAASSTEPTTAIFTGLYETNTALNATVKTGGLTFSIATQSIGSTSFGTVGSVTDGTISSDGHTINLVYKYTENGTTFHENCTAVLVHQ